MRVGGSSRFRRQASIFVRTGEQLIRNGEAERLGGREIDHQREFGRSLNLRGIASRLDGKQSRSGLNRMQKR